MTAGDRSRCAHAIAGQVELAHPTTIARLRGDIVGHLGGRRPARVIDSGDGVSYAVDDRIAPTERLYGRAHDIDCTATVAVAHSCHPDVSGFGSFDAAGAVLLVRVTVFGIPVEAGDIPPSSVADAAVPITYCEAEGWARAALGRSWSLRLYQYDYARMYSDSATRFRFALLLDQHGTAISAPPDFDWSQVNERTAAAVREIDSSAD